MWTSAQFEACGCCSTSQRVVQENNSSRKPLRWCLFSEPTWNTPLNDIASYFFTLFFYRRKRFHRYMLFVHENEKYCESRNCLSLLSATDLLETWLQHLRRKNCFKDFTSRLKNYRAQSGKFACRNMYVQPLLAAIALRQFHEKNYSQHLVHNKMLHISCTCCLWREKLFVIHNGIMWSFFVRVILHSPAKNWIPVGKIYEGNYSARHEVFQSSRL